MIIGVPTEILDNEYRVAMTPTGVRDLTHYGHKVLIQQGAGLGSTISNEAYANFGAELVETSDEIYARADMILKVKEPKPEEYDRLHENQILFTYLHLAASKTLTEALMKSGCIAIAYETIQLPDGRLPLLTPMSEIAGRMAVQIGAQYLEKMNGGRGILLGGIAGVPSAHVVIVGGGTSGTQAAKVALGMGARVTILDKNVERLRYLDNILQGRYETIASDMGTVAKAAERSVLLIGAVLIPGAKTPTLVPEDVVKNMKQGSVLVDISIDQGGCIETIHPTSHSNPTYTLHGVVHYGVTNMPGAVPRTSTFALTNETLPYVLMLANKGYKNAIEENPPLQKGVNIANGTIVHHAVAEAFPELSG